MQASDLEQCLKTFNEDKENRKDLEDAITYASGKLGLTTITASWEKIILAMITLIVRVFILYRIRHC